MNRLVLLALALLGATPIASAQSTIFLVRHAEKAGVPAGSDAKDPELSEAGQARAAALARVLKDAQLTGIFASEFKRTQQTAEPVARDFRLQVTTVPAKETPALVAKLKEAKGNVLVVGHSNTLPEIIKALGVQTSVAIDEADYDNLFVLTPKSSPPELLHLHYGRQGPD